MAACAFLRMRSANFLLLLALAAIAGCASGDREATAQHLAQSGGLERSSVEAGGFMLTVFTRFDDPRQPVHVYIEGDGLAWLSRTEPSPDPTPRNPLGLTLAAEDPAANVVYLARPCQYTDLGRVPCDQTYWTDRRYSREVVSALAQALDACLLRAPGQRIHLVGYSGGAAIAVLLAAQRTDVASLRSVAGNLDPEAVNRHHQVSPMPGSLDPMDVAPMLADLPQVLFVGSADRVVPASVAQSYAQRVGAANACVRIVEVAGATHGDGWRGRWPELLRESPACTRPGQPAA